MIWTSVIAFLINIVTFILLEYFCSTYCERHKSPFAKFCVIFLASTGLYFVNTYKNPALNVIAGFLLVLLFSLIFNKGNKVKTLAFSIVFVAINSLAELLCTFIISLILSTPLGQTIEDTLLYLTTGILGTAILLIILVTVRKKFPPHFVADKGSDMLVLSLFPAASVVNMLVILEYDKQLQTPPPIHLLTIFSLLLFVFLSIVVFFLYNSALHKKALEIQLQLNREVHNMNELLFKQQQKEMDALHRIKHEFNRHITNIFDFTQQEKLVQAREYCQQVLGEISSDDAEVQLLDFHNFTVSNIYARFISNCKTNDISILADIQFVDFSFVRDIDAAVLLNNLFDNAVDSCKEVSTERKINFSIFKVQDNIIIKLANSMCHPIKKRNETFLSTKRGYSAPGLGVPQMISIAEIYGGYVTSTFTDYEFETIIRLSLR